MSAASEVRSSRSLPGPWRVLLVTDGLVDQKLLSRLLTKNEHRVFVVGGGREAFLQWSENQFDVVLLDAILPEMDGAELTRRIRQHENDAHRATIIIVLTENEADRARCLQAGADNCLSRPLQITEFHASVLAAKGLVPVAEGGELLEEQIDWQVALDAVGGRRDLLTELVAIFCAEYPTTVESIRQAIDRSDAKLLQLSAHQLKGSLRYFGNSTAGELAHSLEEMGRSGRTDAAASRVESLAAAVQRLVPKLRQGPA